MNAVFASESFSSNTDILHLASGICRLSVYKPIGVISPYSSWSLKSQNWNSLYLRLTKQHENLTLYIESNTIVLPALLL